MAFLHPSKLPSYRNKFIPHSFNYQDTIKPLNGIEVSIPVLIYNNIFSYLHYGFIPDQPLNTILLVCLSYFSYGRDRYKDAYEYLLNPSNSSKIELYDVINNNRPLFFSSHSITLFIILSILLSSSYFLPFILCLYSTEFYKDIKSNFGCLKPFYVSFLWTTVSIILPSVIYEHNYNIISYPLDYLPVFFSIFGSTNLADIKDIHEDQFNNITTFASFIGRDYTYFISFLSLILTSFIVPMNSHFNERPVANYLFEIQTIATTIPIILSYFNITNLIL